MKLRKKSIFGILALASIMSLASCNGGGTTNDGYEHIKVAFVEAGFGRTFLEKWEEGYNAKYPDAKIKLDLEGDAQMTQNILPRIQSGRNLPDLVMVLSTNWQPWAVQNFLEPIDDLYETEVEGTTKLKDYIVDGLKEFGKVKDHYYAIPWSVNPCGLIYNAGMFEQYGWKIPETFEELVTLCNTIKTDTGGAVAPFSWSGAVSAYWDFTVLQWWAQIEGRANWETFWKFESPDVYAQAGRLKALQCFETLICDSGKSEPKNSIKGAMSKKFMESQMSFVNGEAAMMSNGAWLENEMKNSLPNNFKMRLMKTPRHADAKTDESPMYNTCGDFFVIPKKATNKTAAKKFLAYTCSEEASKIFTKESGGIRPFNYKPSKVEGITEFTKECAELWENSDNVYLTSNSVLYYQNNCNTWPEYGVPYNKMIQEGDTAQDVHNYILNTVKTRWSAYQTEAGNFGKDE